MNESIEVRVALVEQALVDVQRALTGHVDRIGTAMEGERDTRTKSNDVWRVEFRTLSEEVSTLRTYVSKGIGIVVTLQVLVPIIFYLLFKK